MGWPIKTYIDATAPPAGLLPCVSDTSTDNWLRSQAQLDYLLSLRSLGGYPGMPPNGGRVHFPGYTGSYLFSRLPVIDGNAIRITGDGKDNTKFALTGPEAGLLLALRRNDVGIGTLNNDDFPPCGLDASMVGLYGYRTNGRHFMTFPSTPASTTRGRFRYLSGARCPVIDLALTLHAGSVVRFGCPLGGDVFGGMPVYLEVQAGGMFWFFWSTTEGGQRSVYGYYPLVAGPTRFTAQLDLDAGTVALGVNGQWVAPYVYGDQPPPPILPGQHLVENYDVDFVVGGGYRGTPDATVQGFAVRLTKVYADGAPGAPQARLDGATITDALRYQPTDGQVLMRLDQAQRASLPGGVVKAVAGQTTAGSGVVSAVPDMMGLVIGQQLDGDTIPAGALIQDLEAYQEGAAVLWRITLDKAATATGPVSLTAYDPHGCALDRRYSVASYGLDATGGFWEYHYHGLVVGFGQTAGNPTQTAGNWLSGVTIGHFQGSAPLVQLGPTRELVIEDVRFIGGTHAIGDYNNGTNHYPITIRDCRFEQTGDVAVRLVMPINFDFRNLSGYPGPNGFFRLYTASSGTIDNLYLSDSAPRWLIDLRNGAFVTISNVWGDIEAGAGVRDALIRCEENPPFGASLFVDVLGATMAPGAVLADLYGGGCGPGTTATFRRAGSGVIRRQGSQAVPAGQTVKPPSWAVGIDRPSMPGAIVRDVTPDADGHPQTREYAGNDVLVVTPGRAVMTVVVVGAERTLLPE